MATSLPKTKAANTRVPGAGAVRSKNVGLATPVEVCVEKEFLYRLLLERRRAERSRNPFLLMLLDARLPQAEARQILLHIATVMAPAIRETDWLGWYEDGDILGAVFTEIGGNDIRAIKETVRSKARRWLHDHLPTEIAAKIVISLHAFPQDWDASDQEWAADAKLYPELHPHAQKKSISRTVKRAIDVSASGLLLILLSPLLGAIAALVKLTSDGPVLFKQERIGQFGKRFKFLKFRSMFLNNAPTIHQEYVRDFIAGSKGAHSTNSAEAPVYKIVNDPRVTPLGRFLRKTSLDELPQLWNVLVGEMSLVGPRPPVPYEFAVYDHWHRRRVLEVKPGITGLWQVNGRSRTTFDEMVRLDLQYATEWSLWLDVKILLATPRAVLSSSGAY
jgi:lipopolysaccharide/colanic/teichoic acid biosynthesis glycosyltransferase